MAFSKSLIFCLVIIIPLLVVVLPNQVVSQGDTTTFTFDRYNPNMRNLTFQGDAFVPSTNSPFVRMTEIGSSSGLPQQGSISRVVYSTPVNFWKKGRQASFETTIRFLITPVSNRTGDGLTFFIVPVSSPIPPDSVDGCFGLFDFQTGNALSVFAVEFDIAANTWDPDYRHIGIDINSRVSSNVTSFDSAGGFVGFVTAQINYNSSTRTITVVAANGFQSARLSYVFDLKTILPRQVQVGISATTGSYVALHDLYHWHFNSTLVDENQLDDDKTSYIRQYVE